MIKEYAEYINSLRKENKNRTKTKNSLEQLFGDIINFNSSRVVRWGKKSFFCDKMDGFSAKEENSFPNKGI